MLLWYCMQNEKLQKKISSKFVWDHLCLSQVELHYCQKCLSLAKAKTEGENYTELLLLNISDFP